MRASRSATNGASSSARSGAPCGQVEQPSRQGRLELVFEPGPGHVLRGARELDPLTTAAQGRQHGRGTRGHQHEQRARRGLLQRLEERVLRIHRHRMRGCHDRDAPTASHARHRQPLGHLAHLLHRDRLAVLRSAQPVQIGMRPGAREQALGAFAAGLERATRASCRAAPPPPHPRIAPCRHHPARAGAARAADDRPQQPPRAAPAQRRATAAPKMAPSQFSSVVGLGHGRSSESAARTAACTSSIDPVASMTRMRCGSRLARAR